MKKSLNTAWIYILSILGLLCCCFFGLGFIFSGPAYLMAQNKLKNAQQNPDDYEGNFSAMETAKVIALVVLIINILYMAWTIYSIATGDWNEIREQWQEAMEKMKKSSV